MFIFLAVVSRQLVSHHHGIGASKFERKIFIRIYLHTCATLSHLLNTNEKTPTDYPAGVHARWSRVLDDQRIFSAKHRRSGQYKQEHHARSKLFEVTIAKRIIEYRTCFKCFCVVHVVFFIYLFILVYPISVRRRIVNQISQYSSSER